MLGVLIFASTPFTMLNNFNLKASGEASRAENIPSAESEQGAVASPDEQLEELPTHDPIVPSWSEDSASQLVFSAINPGYTVDGLGDVGELIELKNLSGAALDLSDYVIAYTNGSGKTSPLVEFPSGSRLEGETLLLRLARRADPGADLTYMTTLALSAGPLTLLHRGQIVDTVCWTGKDGCTAAFDSAAEKRTTLVRNLTTGEFEHQSTYQPAFDPNHLALVLPPDPTNPDGPDGSDPADPELSSATPQCYKIEFSEILTYYNTAKTEQFIEFYNPSDSAVQLDGCKVRYKNKTYPLAGKIAADGYTAFYPASIDLTLTKNPSSSNLIELLDVNGAVVDALEYPHGQRKSAAFARFYDQSGEENWSLTYAATPGAPNDYQEFRSCPAGKVINPETGNCVKATSITTTECPAGKYRNPLTGRCKKIATAATQKECAAGYERNPETNRCRKITTANNGAEYALVPTTYSDHKSFIGLGVVAILVLLGVVYIILQFRREIARATRKLVQRVHHFGKDLRSGKIVHRDRHK